MSRHKLIPALIKTFKYWRAENKRDNWIYCPLCKHDLNGDNKSFIKDDGKYWWYKCSKCGCKSKWYFHMMPYPVATQKLTSKLHPLKQEES